MSGVNDTMAAVESRRLRRVVPGLPRSIWTLRDGLAAARAHAHDRLTPELARQFVRAQFGNTDGPHQHVDPIDTACLVLLAALVRLHRVSADNNRTRLARLGSHAVGADELAETLGRDAVDGLQFVANYLATEDATLAPYILEELDRPENSDDLIWTSKRSRGVFYTPPDVANYMVSRLLGSVAGLNLRLYDPACGAGAFLTAALGLLVQRGTSITDALAQLAGSDISDSALLTTVFALMVRAIALDPHVASISALYGQLQGQFAIRDLRDAAGGQTLWSVPAAGAAPGLQELAVIANPPYLRWADARASGRSVYRALVELVLSPRTHSASLLLPLSVATDTSAHGRATRDVMASAGQWRFAFFDRSPDSLFGDAVKTRHVIAHYLRGSHALETTKLMRWSYQKRSELFRNLSFTSIDGMPISEGIPKLGSIREVAVYRQLRAGGPTFGAYLPVTRYAESSVPNSVLIGESAYNWIPLYRAEPTHGDRANIKWSIVCRGPAEADAVFALFTSHLAYWLWLVEGDGFHVSRRFLENFPLDISALPSRTSVQLAEVGTRYWGRALGSPKIKANAGRAVARFAFEECLQEMDEATSVLCDALGFGSDIAPFLRARRLETWAAGRTRPEDT
jgi:hypothetical protein